MVKKTFYLDVASTNPVSKEVVSEMSKYYLEEYGNPSAYHELGENALEAINKAREKLAKEINAKTHEIYFTSGATESNNLALKGLWKSDKKKIIISAIEHPSIKETSEFLKKVWAEVVEISVDKEGVIDIGQLENSVDSNTCVVSVMHVNNIIGTIQDLKKIGEICNRKNVILHTDAVQSFGKLEIDVQKMNISLLSVSGHKIGSPKGIGFLYVRDGVELEPMLHGGGQEKDLRSGTENVTGIIGFAKALELSKKIDKEKIGKTRDKLMDKLEKIGGTINGAKDERRIYNNINVSFQGVDNKTLVAFLSHKGIYVSAGSACESRKNDDNQTLKAIGVARKERDGSIRITIGEGLAEKDIDFIVKEIKNSVDKLKI